MIDSRSESVGDMIKNNSYTQTRQGTKLPRKSFTYLLTFSLPVRCPSARNPPFRELLRSKSTITNRFEIRLDGEYYLKNNSHTKHQKLNRVHYFYTKHSHILTLTHLFIASSLRLTVCIATFCYVIQIWNNMRNIRVV